MNEQHGPFEIVDKRRITVTENGLTTVADLPEQNPLAEVDRVYDDPLPIFDRILIRRGAKQTVFAGTTFYIPETAQKAPNQGVVVSTAENYIVEGKAFPMSALVKPGDLVTFSSFNGEEIARDGETYILCSIFDVKLIERVHFAIGETRATGA